MLFRSYLRNKPTNTNNATNPANPDSPKVFMIDVRLPITLTPKIPVPKITSETAPMATKDKSKWAKSSTYPLTIVMISFIGFLPLVRKKSYPNNRVTLNNNYLCEQIINSNIYLYIEVFRLYYIYYWIITFKVNYGYRLWNLWW